MHAAGTYHATKKSVVANHLAEYSMRWRQMAFETGNIQLQSLLSSGDLKTSEIFYHLECYLDKFHEDRARTAQMQQKFSGKRQRHLKKSLTTF